MTSPGRPLRVLMVNTHAHKGGAARMAATLARALDASGEATVKFVHCGDTERQPPFYGIRRPGSRELNAFLARCGGSLAVLDMGVADEIARQAKEADVIHLHNLHGYYLDWNRLLKEIADHPLVWTWHDMWGATGRCGFSFECDGWRSGCDPCPHLEYYPRAWLDRAAPEYRRKTEWLDGLQRLVIASPSEWLRQIAIDRGVHPDRVVFVPNPVDVRSYRPGPMEAARQRLGLMSAARYLLFVASDCNNPMKGYGHFLEVVRLTGWNGLVAGGKPNQVPAGIRYLGEFREIELLRLCYSAADALVVPSRFDNSPNTVVEGMSCGTPAFGFAVGGIPSQMHSRWGGAVPVGDDRGLAAKIVEQLHDGGKTDPIVHELRDYATLRWGSDMVAGAYLALYRRVIGS